LESVLAELQCLEMEDPLFWVSLDEERERQHPLARGKQERRVEGGVADKFQPVKREPLEAPAVMDIVSLRNISKHRSWDSY